MNRKFGVILSIISIVFEVIFTLVVTPFLIKILGQSEFGIYKMCLSIIAYVLLLDLGIGNSIIRFASKFRFNKDKQNERKLAGVSLSFYLTIAFIGLILGFVIMILFPYVFQTGLTEQEILLGKKLILITSATSAITLATSGFYNIIIAYEHFFISKGLTVLQNVLKIFLSLVVLKMGFGSIGVCVVNLVLTTIIRFFYVFYAINILKIRPTLKGCNRDFISEIIGYSGLIAIQMIATQLNQSIDQIFIGSFVSNSSGVLGVYAIGAQINQYFMSIGVAITGVLMPGIVKFAESNPSAITITKEMTRLSRLILFPLIIIYSGFVILGKEFITLWVGIDYIDAYLVAVILISPQLLASAFSPLLQFVWAINKQKELSWTKLIIVLLNCFLTFILIKWNPILGASIGTMLSVFFGDVLMLIIIFKKKAGLHVYSFLEQTFLIPVITIFTISVFAQKLFGMFSNSDGWISFLIQCVTFCAVSFIFMYFVAFNSYEKNQIKKIFLKFKTIKNKYN